MQETTIIEKIYFSEIKFSIDVVLCNSFFCFSFC